MRHLKSGKKLSRSVSHRRALLRNMASSFILHERAETTLPKAKTLKGVVEKLVGMAKKDDLHKRRQAYSYLMDKSAVHKLFTDVAPRFKNRNGGFTRVVRTGFRHGDAAQMALIEFVEKKSAATIEKESAPAAKKEKAPKKAKAAAKKPAKAKAA